MLKNAFGIGCLVVAWTIPLVGVALSATAKADVASDLQALSRVQFAYVNTYGKDALCAAINEKPTLTIVQGAVLAVMDDGFMRGEAESIVSVSVETFCSTHMDLISLEKTRPLPVVKA